MNAQEISTGNRRRKYDLFLNVLNPSEQDTILDVGFSNIEYSEVDNYLEKNYPFQKNITALGIDEPDLFQSRYPDVNVIRYDGKKFPFSDKSFDIGWSNAVIEHVGNEEKQILFLKELRRTCNTVYFTTPNRWFPFELHTRLPLLHWLPKRFFDTLLSFTSKKWATNDYMHLLSESKLKKILKKAEITQYRIYRNKFMGFTMDFCVIILNENLA